MIHDILLVAIGVALAVLAFVVYAIVQVVRHPFNP